MNSNPSSLLLPSTSAFSFHPSSLLSSLTPVFSSLTPVIIYIYPSPSIMPEKNFIIKLSDVAFIFVYFLTNKGEIGKFVVKLNVFFEDQVIELARYDSGLHEPHLDILHPNGFKKRVVDYSMLENAQAINVAIEDFSNNWEFYWERWQRWAQEEK